MIAEPDNLTDAPQSPAVAVEGLSSHARHRIGLGVYRPPQPKHTRPGRRSRRPGSGRNFHETLLDAVGLADKANAQPHNLSAEQCQRVALARALVGQPDLILADEPTASLDAANGQEVMKLLLRLTVHEGKTVVVVSHDPRIFDLADRIFRLEDGRIVDDAQPVPEPVAAS